MSEWSPIATAPKDGSIIRLRDDKKIYNCVMRWNKRKKRWEGMSYGALGASRTTWDENFCKIHEWAHVGA